MPYDLTGLCRQHSVCKQHRQSAEARVLCCNIPCNHFVSVQTLLRRESNNKETMCELAQTTAVKLLPNESHDTANVSLLACLQKLSSATVTYLSSIWLCWGWGPTFWDINMRILKSAGRNPCIVFSYVITAVTMNGRANLHSCLVCSVYWQYNTIQYYVYGIC